MSVFVSLWLQSGGADQLADDALAQLRKEIEKEKVDVAAAVWCGSGKEKCEHPVCLSQVLVSRVDSLMAQVTQLQAENARLRGTYAALLWRMC